MKTYEFACRLKWIEIKILNVHCLVWHTHKTKLHRELHCEKQKIYLCNVFDFVSLKVRCNLCTFSIISYSNFHTVFNDNVWSFISMHDMMIFITIIKHKWFSKVISTGLISNWDCVTLMLLVPLFLSMQSILSFTPDIMRFLNGHKWYGFFFYWY